MAPTSLAPPQKKSLMRSVLYLRIYIRHFKINTKQAFKGDVWPWHQDYSYWKKEDGMPTARVLNIAIFLDEVNEFNGTLVEGAGVFAVKLAVH